MRLPLFRLLAATLLLATAQASLHTSLRGGWQRSLRVQNATVGKETAYADLQNQAGYKDLMNKEVDDTFSSDIDDDDDPESVYEATLQDEQVKAELASHEVQTVDSNASSDLESIYKATRETAQSDVESILAKKVAEAKTKLVGKQEAKVNTTTAVRPRVNRIKQLMDTIAHNSVQNVKKLANPPVPNVKKFAIPPVPRVSMQIHTKRAHKRLEKPRLKKDVDGKADVNAVSQDSTIADKYFSNAESAAVHATAKIVERGRAAKNENGDDNEVGIVGVESVETNDENAGAESAETDDGNAGAEEGTKDAQEVDDGEENAAVDDADGEEHAADDEQDEADTTSEDSDDQSAEDEAVDTRDEEDDASA